MPFTISKKYLPKDLPSFKDFQAKAAELGVEISGDDKAGRIGGFGVSGGYVIGADMVTITVEKTPFFAPEKMVREKIQEWLDSFGG